jgi:hypothetical protein
METGMNLFLFPNACLTKNLFHHLVNIRLQGNLILVITVFHKATKNATRRLTGSLKG